MHSSQKKCVHSVEIPYFCGKPQHIKHSSTLALLSSSSIINASVIFEANPVPMQTKHLSKRSTSVVNCFFKISTGGGAFFLSPHLRFSSLFFSSREIFPSSSATAIFDVDATKELLILSFSRFIASSPYTNFSATCM